MPVQFRSGAWGFEGDNTYFAKNINVGFLFGYFIPDIPFPDNLTS